MQPDEVGKDTHSAPRLASIVEVANECLVECIINNPLAIALSSARTCACNGRPRPCRCTLEHADDEIISGMAARTACAKHGHVSGYVSLQETCACTCCEF